MFKVPKTMPGEWRPAIALALPLSDSVRWASEDRAGISRMLAVE